MSDEPNSPRRPATRPGRADEPPPPPPPPSRQRPAPFIALFVAALMLFNFPLLLIWDQPVTVFGLPLLGVALFVIWGGLILALALVSERRGNDARTNGSRASEQQRGRG